MKKLRVRSILKRYIGSLSFGELDSSFWKKKRNTLNGLSEKLAAKLKTEEDIEEYLETVIEHISSLNIYFKKEGRFGRIPYSAVLNFANKEETLSSFLLDKGIKNRIKKETNSLAGFDSSGKEVDPLEDLKKLSFYHKGKDYEFIFLQNGKMFFYSPENRKIFVQYSGGKVRSFEEFKRRNKKLGKSFITTGMLYRRIKKDIKKNDAMKSFLIYMRQRIARFKKDKWNQKK